MLMKIRKKNILLILFCFANLFCFAQQAHILTFNVKPVLPAEVNNWTTVPAAVVLVVQAQGPGSGMVKPVFTIKQGGTRICGNTASTAGFVNIAPSHNFTVAEITGNLTGCPKLPPGSYSLCVQFYPEDPRQQGEVKEVCREFRVEDAVPEFCNPPQNMGPQEGKIFTEKDFLSPKIFTWSPFITSSHLPVTYRLTVWEVEEGQSPAQAMYDNLPVLQQEVTGQTRYISAPGVWERRTATYIWRVEAIDREGNLLCKTAVSSPTIFKIVIPEPKDEIPPAKPDSCCSDTIKILSNTVTVAPANMLNIVQNFTLSPGNIKQVSAEIDLVNESASDTSCRKCAVNEAAVWNFMPINKAIWNSGTPISGSPVNASGTYPAQHILWYCNQQGNLKLDLQIALPGIIASAACKRTGTIGIWFSFTDKDCRTCEKYIIYPYSVN